MGSLEDRIEEFEQKRIALNQQLMNASTVTDANRIERELWALRAAIESYRSQIQSRKLARHTAKPHGKSSPLKQHPFGDDQPPPHAVANVQS